MTLSGGQRQRIALARAALRQAPILVLDEPTTGLDQENERTVLEALAGLAEGRTTFIIAHDLELAARADLILYLERGRVLEHGSHAELMHAGGRYAGLYGRQEAPPPSPPGVHDDRVAADHPLADREAVGNTQPPQRSAGQRKDVNGGPVRRLGDVR
jgi:ABC-type multidrug transport system ATPase subunit